MRSAFEPTEAELAALTNRARGSSEDVVMADVEEADKDEDFPQASDLVGSIKSAKASEMQKSVQVFELNDGDVMPVQSDQGGEEDEERRRAIEKKLGKRKAVVVSDDEEDPKNIIRGKKAAEQVKLSSKFLPSTKMKAKDFSLSLSFKADWLFWAVHDGVHSKVGHRTS
jgi:hypothetical protein